MIDERTELRTPGQLLRSLLTHKGWTQEILATVLGVSPSMIARLATDRQPIDAPKAIAFAELFGVTPESFLELQKSYDLARAKIETRPDPERARRAHLYSKLPVGEMARRGWLNLDNVRDAKAVEKAVAAFFDTESPDDIPVLPHASKKTNVGEDVTGPQIAWLRRVRMMASTMLVKRYSDIALQRAIKKLQMLLLSAEEARHVPRILSECGVRFVVAETLESAKIDGVCFWLDARSPVVGMSMRYDRIDNFWFVLRHELEHVRRGHGREQAKVDSELEGERAGTGPDVGDEERVANQAASDFCVPSDLLRQFIARKAPIFPERDILGFAKTIGVHPGLVAGQLRHHTGRYDRFHHHLVKIRSVVTPGAMVDGWGDVAPLGV